MISLEEAQRIILEKVTPLEKMKVPLSGALHGVLAEDIYSPVNIPNSDCSRMDGYAVSLTKVPQKWHLLEGQVKAGDPTIPVLNEGEAISIFTGARLPIGTMAVLPLEEVTLQDDELIALSAPENGLYVRKKGTDLQQGELVLPRGRYLRAMEIGLLASSGLAEVLIYRRPRVAVLATGDELVTPGSPLEAGQVYDSNSYGLVAALRETGVDAYSLGTVKDDPVLIKAILKKELPNIDLLITTAGASVGTYDFTRRVFEKLGVTLYFDETSIKPGKPTLFGICGEKVIFGLAGNPVAALVTFEIYVRLALYRMMGSSAKRPPRFSGILQEGVDGDNSRLSLIRGVAVYENGRFLVRPAGVQTSSRLKGMSEANCLIIIPAESRNRPGEALEFQFIGVKSVGY